MKEEQNIKELPEGWKWEKLDDALDMVIGGDWGKDENYEDPKYGIAYCIRGSEIKNWEEEKGRTASLRKIKLSNIEKRRLIEGDILVEISGGGPEQPVGRTVLIDKTVLSHKPETPKICTNFLRLIRPKDHVEGKFLNLYLKLFYYSGEIVKYQGGSNNLRNLKFPDYVKINFPLPPKTTQQAIVSKIEELFSELDKGIENLRLAQQQLKTYRQSVLKWAFEGRLTNEWRIKNSNVKSATEFLSEVAKKRENKYKKTKNKTDKNFDYNYKQSEEISSWAKATLDKLIYIAGRIGWRGLKKDEYTVDGPLFLSVHSLNYGKYVAFKDAFHISKERYLESPEIIVKEQDILLCKDGAGIGKIAIINKLPDFATVNSSLLVIRGLEIFIPEFLYYLLSGPALQSIVKDRISGSATPHLFQNDIRKFELLIPPIEEQNAIIKEIESRLSVADKMEENITQSLLQVEVLRQSILKKAFEGKLITPETGITSLPKQAKVIPIERKVLAGKIIHLFNDDRNFGLTKFQKTFFLVEHHIRAAYEADYLRDAAGPYDKEFTLAFRKEMEQEGWFTEEMKYRKTRFVVGDNVGSLIKEYPIFFREKGKDITFVLQLLKDKTTHESELIATLYAVWNNRLMKKMSIKENDLMSDFFNWSPKKKEEFQEEEISATYKWMKEVKLVPTGFGKEIK